MTNNAPPIFNYLFYDACRNGARTVIFRIAIKYRRTSLVRTISVHTGITSQFYIIYNALLPQNQLVDIFISIAAYFMLTSLIPMISIIEPAIRAAIALFVFNNTT